jgi:predicted phage-related endonuclease
MHRQMHNDAPGSPAWSYRRARSFNAGDASAMLGCHPSGKTRTQLLHEMHTGLERQFSDYVQERVIDPGHRIEALWRPIAEEIIGEDLQVLAFSLQVAGLSRPLGASLDGVTFMEDVLGECKSANDALRAALPNEGRDSHERNDARLLPKGYRVQVEQQQLVTGATRTLFSACLFDAAGNPTEERHCWYESDPVLRAEILAGWRQFEADLAAYVPPAASAVEKIVAEPVEALPAPVVTVSGQLTLQDNFKVFEQKLRHFLEHRLIREPKTDQDFADLDAQIKSMKQAREALKAAEAQMLAQVQPVDQAKKTKDMLDKLLQQNCSMAEKILSEEKERRRGEIVAGGIGELQKHVAALNQRLGKPYMPTIPADFGGCIKGLKSLASMEDKVATELARAKIAANEVADRIQANLTTLRELASEHAFLFADTATLVLKAPEDCRAQVANRIAEHKAAEERRLEAERARIRAEEEARARAQAQREQQEREAAERRQREEQEAAAHAAAERQRQEEWLAGADEREARRQAEMAGAVLQQRQQVAADAPAPATNVLPMPTKAPAGPPTLTLTEIKKRIAPLAIDAAGLATLGIPHAKQEGAAKLWHEHQFTEILDAVIAHAARVKLKHLEAA